LKFPGNFWKPQESVFI